MGNAGNEILRIHEEEMEAVKVEKYSGGTEEGKTSREEKKK